MKEDQPVSEDPAISPLRLQRREKLVEAAEGIFARYGARGTTMEQIARAAGLSKATVYGYFADKDAVFIAVGEAVAQRILSSVHAALAEPSPVARRVAAGLIAKHRIVSDLMRASAFASELFETKDRIFSDRTAKLDDAIREALVAAIQTEKCNGKDAKALSQLLFAAADGIATHGVESSRIAADIEELCRLVLSAKFTDD